MPSTNKNKWTQDKRAGNVQKAREVETEHQKEMLELDGQLKEKEVEKKRASKQMSIEIPKITGMSP